jgi:hypothetical protein
MNTVYQLLIRTAILSSGVVKLSLFKGGSIMRRIILATGMLILVTVVVAAANPIAWPPWGDIILCQDMDGFDGFFDATPGLISINVIVSGVSGDPGAGLTACQFAAPVSQCFNGVWLSDSQVFPVTLGDSQTGVAIGFGQCLQAPVHVLTINLFCQGPGTECCFVWAVPHPSASSGEIELVDCTETLYFGTGGAAIIQPDANQCMQYVPVQETTWGKMKSLYAK